MNAETPRAERVPGSVRAKSSSVPPNAAFVIHCFAPRTCQPPSTALGRRDERARVRARARLREREAADRLAARERRDERAPCSACRTRGSAACTRTCARRRSRRPRRRARESSSSTRMYETKSAPAPPCSSGTHTPSSPSSPSRAEQRRAGSRARGPSRRRSARSRRRRTRGRAPGSRAAPASARSPRAADYPDEMGGDRGGPGRADCVRRERRSVPRDGSPCLERGSEQGG